MNIIMNYKYIINLKNMIFLLFFTVKIRFFKNITKLKLNLHCINVYVYIHFNIYMYKRNIYVPIYI